MWSPTHIQVTGMSYLYAIRHYLSSLFFTSLCVFLFVIMIRASVYVPKSNINGSKKKQNIRQMCFAQKLMGLKIPTEYPYMHSI